MAESKLGIRVFQPPFTGMLSELERAASVYFKSPVKVKLPIVLMDPSDFTVAHVADEITITIVNVDHKGDDENIVLLRAKIVEGTKNFKKVPVNDENINKDMEVLRDGDDIVIIADTACGDAAIIQNSNDKKIIDFDDLSSILPRLEIPCGLPVSPSTPISWEDFIANAT